MLLLGKVMSLFWDGRHLKNYPKTSRLNWAIIEEPNKRLKKEGSLYLWVIELDEFGKKFGKPRSYNLYWNEDNQKLVQSALHKLQEGEQLNGKKNLWCS